MPCCFFGHHDAPEQLKPMIAEQVEELIKNGETTFYVGTHGGFDFMTIRVLREMKEAYPHINYGIVLAYMPDASPEDYSFIKPEETLYPTGLESVPRKFAILWRNDWMLKESDTVICYAKHHLGGAGKFTEKAIKQKKRVINLAGSEGIK